MRAASSTAYSASSIAARRANRKHRVVLGVLGVSLGSLLVVLCPLAIEVLTNCGDVFVPRTLHVVPPGKTFPLPSSASL